MEKVIDVRPYISQFILHPLMQAVYISFLVIAPGNTALVGYDEDEIPLPVIMEDSLLRTRYPAEILRPVQVADVFVQYTVAVEKNGRSGLHRPVFLER